MSREADDIEVLRAENQRFYEKADVALRRLFESARSRHELHFAMSLNPEFRGMQDAGWSSAGDAIVAFSDYKRFLEKQGENPRFRTRVGLSFYCHLAEASGFYEIPKNMLRVASGDAYHMDPFSDLVVHRQSGKRVAPNANKIIRDLAGHATHIGQSELAEVFRDAFDAGVRNAYAHADYVVWRSGIRIGMRHGPLREISYSRFNALFERGISFFQLLREVVDESITSYNPPKIVRARLATDPEGDWKIAYNPDSQTFTISG